VTPLQPANCGFIADWSQTLRERHAGQPLKGIVLTFQDRASHGEAMITSQGLEGGAIYALAAPLREAIAQNGSALCQIDLRPDVSIEALAERLAGERGKASLSNFLRKRAGLSPAALGLVQEALHTGENKPLAALIKSLPVTLTAPFDIARAISTAGGIALCELDKRLMLRRRPGVFAAGEMLDWEAPTGGYLLHGCLATGAAAGLGLVTWLLEQNSDG
jgi:uncharacterized flavoprotein (TIGR03862 family)